MNTPNHTPHAGMAAMEAAAARDLAESAEQERRTAAMQERSSLENDRAELELFGSRGRTYHDPETGAVIADAENPTIGMFDAMASNPRFGKTEAERLQKVAYYEQMLQEMVEEGTELAQAKLLIDLHLQDEAKRGKLIGERITNGESALDAEDHVEGLLERMAEKRKDLIIAGGALSMDDYTKLRKGEDLYPNPDTVDDTLVDTDDEHIDAIDEAAANLDSDGEAQPTVSVEIPAELQEAFIEARNNYAERTAKDRRSYVGRFFKNPKSPMARILSKIPGVKKLRADMIPGLNKLNDKLGAKTEAAAAAYEEAADEIQTKIIEACAAAGLPDEQIRGYAIGKALELEADFEREVVERRHASSKKTNKFVNFWTRQQGYKGMFVKGAILAGGGALLGVGGAIVATGFVGATVAGVAAGAGMHHVSRRRANAVVNGKTVAEYQSGVDFQQKETLASAVMNEPADNRGIWQSTLVDVTEARSASEMYKNRKRVLGSAALAASGARLGAFGYDFFSHLGSSDTPASLNSAKPNAQPTVPHPETSPELKGLNFTVESGHGYTHELMDFAQANGHNLSPDQSYELHQHLMNKFGTDYISTDVYNQMGDIRLSHPGAASWNAGVGQEIQAWMGQKGLW